MDMLKHNQDESISAEIQLYNRRREDGINAAVALISELRLNSINNNLPRAVLKDIETAFAKVDDNIRKGWWITAKEECEAVTVGGNVTQELWERIYNTITAYIAQNY